MDEGDKSGYSWAGRAKETNYITTDLPAASLIKIVTVTILWRAASRHFSMLLSGLGQLQHRTILPRDLQVHA